MLDIKDVKVGDMVYYKPAHFTDGQEENGIVKEIPENQDMFARVVFHCAGNWDRYQDYTGQQTNLLDLNSGWKEQLKTIEIENRPIIISGKSVDRWFAVGNKNDFWQKREYAVEYLTEQGFTVVNSSDMKPSQLISQGEMDDAYDELHGQVETLRTEKAALSQALEGLLTVHRDLRAAELAANQVLSTLEE